MPSVNVITFYKKEEESADFQIWLAEVSPPLIDTDKCCSLGGVGPPTLTNENPKIVAC